MVLSTRSPNGFLRFERDAWSGLKGDAPLTLGESELEQLLGIGSVMNIEDVVQIYLPISRLLAIRRSASQQLRESTGAFLGRELPAAPFIIGLAGSVAVGKSTTARVLEALIAGWPSRPTVELVTTDGFLMSNAELEGRGILHRKGFPESYDRGALRRFVAALKAGEPEVRCREYSHLIYDVIPDRYRVLRQPDVVIVEGLNVLQTGPRACVSDYFDFSIYLHADLGDLRAWYVSRFLKLRDTAFRDPDSYFLRYAELDDDAANARALEIWRTINEVNLVENIEPTRERSDLVLEKGPDHRVDAVLLRRT